MVKPLVSIIVPIYNHELYLEECLNSFLELEYHNFEIVLCNDGSTDMSLEIAERWVKTHQSVKVKLLTQENQGICKTLNRLIIESNGDFISICASDDSLTRNSLCCRVKELLLKPSKLACIGDAYLIDQSSRHISQSAMKYLYKSSYNGLENNIAKELVLRWAVIGPTLLIRRVAYDELGFYDETLKVEDREYYLRLIACDSLTFIANNVANYRVHTDNVSRKSIKAKLVILKDVAASNLKHARFFTGFNKWFLLSHRIDLFVINDNCPNASYYLLSFYRLLRKLIVKVVL